MLVPLAEAFHDEEFADLVRRGLPRLFQLAELECSRAGRIGMEVGSLRERIIAALLVLRFGEGNVETHIPITMPEVDVHVYGQPLSIKTITSKGFGGVKLIWTVDAIQARSFYENYYPRCDMLLVQVTGAPLAGCTT